VWRDETFGPVLPVMSFADEAEAIRLSNDTAYGLCASVFTADPARAMRVARALEVGGVSVNNVNMSEGNPGLPFGGVKQSGFGRLRGPEGLLGFTTSKAILIDKSAPKIEANWYPYTEEKLRRFNRFIDALYTARRPRLPGIAWHGLGLERFSQKPRR
jgi:delta 1-pyrroline-5-carboxylate dehydrogenase